MGGVRVTRAKAKNKILRNLGPSETPLAHKRPRAPSKTLTAEYLSKPNKCSTQCVEHPSPGSKDVQLIRHRGVKFKVDDAVYVTTNSKKFNASGGLDATEEYEVCELCHNSVAGTDGMAPLLECSKCTRGFHTVCLVPQMYSIPEDDWFCDDCKAGKAVKPPDTLVTLRQRYLAGGSGIDVCKILSITKRPDVVVGAKRARKQSAPLFDCMCCWYSRPEDTKVGRTDQMGAREIFATDSTDKIPCEALLRPCSVLLPRAFAAASAAGDDVFLCQYLDSWKGFKRLDDEDTDSDDNSSNEDFVSNPHLDLKDDGLSLLAPQTKHKGSKGPKTKQRKQQGGVDWELGAATLPCSTQGSPLEQASAALATTTQPRSLPCREQERAKIEGFVRKALLAGMDGPGSCMFIGGKPGTGKTATVTDVMRSLRSERKRGTSLPPFRFITINGLRLSTPTQAYTMLYEAMTGARLGPIAAGEALTELFQHGECQSEMTVLLVDELDQMVKGTKQEVVYNLMEWPLQHNSRLIVIGIGNTIDMPERLLPRINSRLGDNKIAFPPYSKHDMRQIMECRLQHAADKRAHKLFTKEALDMATIKAAHTADLRKSLQLGIRAIELAQSDLAADTQAAGAGGSGEGPSQQQAPQQPDYIGLVTIDHVIAASKEMFAGSDVVAQMCDNMSVVCQLFMAAVLIQLRITGLLQLRMYQISNRVAEMAASHGMDVARFEASHCVLAAVQLKAQGFLHAVGEGLAMQISLVDNFPDHVLRDSLCRKGAVPWLAGLNLG